ncbi:MAG TPA: LamG-like jellyroll fold domain-containing protein, partial [Verrucomicrobiae bacterium]|nr:LamG-like jellyroll fold domain-containing protein [Verrucomicrobiae bacterium]
PILTLLMCFLCASSLRADVPMPGPGETNIVLESWSFEKTTNGPWASDDGYSPLSFTNLSTSNLGQGTALVVDSTNAAWLRYNSNEADGHTNITVSQGTIMMWFASTSWASTNEPSGTGPGNWARLLEIGEYTTNASYGWFSLYLDPAGTHVYFSSQTNNGCQNTYFSAPVDFKTNRWHHLAVTYASTNCSFFLDGALVTNGLPIEYWPGPSVLTNGFTIGSDTTGLLQAHGMFDDVATYGYPLDAQSIQGEFEAEEIYFLLNPMNAANLTQAPSEPVTTPTFQAITGSGFLTPIATNASCVTTSNVWLTNVSTAYANNGTMNLTFTIAGGSNGCVHDVFATPALEYPLTNGQWYWMGQGAHCVTYTITNLPNYSAMFILGTPQDSDGDGLTDAYELLVSHTDPNNPDTFGVGMSDGWQLAYLGYVGANGYTLCPSGDGWTYIQAYQNGCLPNQFCTPPAPTGLAVAYTNGIATLTWDPSPGPVIGYVVERDIPALWATTPTSFFTNSATLTAHADDPFPTPEPDGLFDAPNLRGDGNLSERVLRDEWDKTVRQKCNYNVLEPCL